jgi:hypothetical protein
LFSCRGLFKKLQIMPLQSQYISSLLLFVAKKMNYFIVNTHNTDTCYNYNLYLPSTNLLIVQKGMIFSGSKIYNHLPLNIKLLSKGIKVFKSSLRSFLIENVFYSIDEYYNFTFHWIFLIWNHWNTLLMNIINLLLNEHVMVFPINNMLITVLLFDYCLIRTWPFRSGSQCSHYPCRSLMYNLLYVQPWRILCPISVWINRMQLNEYE